MTTRPQTGGRHAFVITEQNSLGASTDRQREGRPAIVPATELSPGPALNPTNLRISCVLTMSGVIVGADSLRSHRKRVGQRWGM